MSGTVFKATRANPSRRVARDSQAVVRDVAPSATILRLQHAAGNQAVQTWLTALRSKTLGGDDERRKAQTAVVGGAAATHALGAKDYGLTFEESVDVEFTAVLDKAKNTWSPSVDKLTGHFSQQIRLLPGQSEVTGPGGNTTQDNYCDQVKNLKALGNIVGNLWYMKAAVKDHEDVHAAHFPDGLKAAEPAIVAAIEAVSIPNKPGLTADQAKVKLKADPTLQAEVANALNLWTAQDTGLLHGDHAAGGPCDVAEHAVVDPMRDKICSFAKGQKWRACPACP